MGLGYPGGKIIDELARQRKPQGGKVAARADQRRPARLQLQRNQDRGRLVLASEAGAATSAADLAASFQEAVVEMLIRPTIAAAREPVSTTIVLTGGVAANSRLRERLAEAAESDGPPPGRAFAQSTAPTTRR